MKTHHSEDSWEIHVRHKILLMNDAIMFLNRLALDNPNQPEITDHLLSSWKASQMLEDMIDLKRTLDESMREARLENAKLKMEYHKTLKALDEAKSEILILQERLI